MELRMLTDTDCLTNIKKSMIALEESSITEEEAKMECARIAVWERIMHHIENGRTVTIDEHERIQLWEESVPC